MEKEKKKKQKFPPLKLYGGIFLGIVLIIGLYFFFFQTENTEWIMPKELNEISGISFLDDHTLACVQDEKGIIFLYDLNKSEITREIGFAGKGDYEGIALKGNTAYVVTGKGTLYEVEDFLTNPKVNTYELNLPPSEESEALCYDKTSGRLLLAFKNHEKDEISPGIFTFDLHTHTLLEGPGIQVDFRTRAIRKKDRNNIKKLWEPADLAIDDVNKKIYVIDAINGHFLRLSMAGQLEKLTPVDRGILKHPEGIAIGADGGIYICNDANKEGKGKILKWKEQND